MASAFARNSDDRESSRVGSTGIAPERRAVALAEANTRAIVPLTCIGRLTCTGRLTSNFLPFAGPNQPAGPLPAHDTEPAGPLTVRDLGGFALGATEFGVTEHGAIHRFVDRLLQLVGGDDVGER